MRNACGIYYHAKVRNERSLGCFGLFCVLQDLPDTDKVSVYVLSAFDIRFSFVLSSWPLALLLCGAK